LEEIFTSTSFYDSRPEEKIYHSSEQEWSFAFAWPIYAEQLAAKLETSGTTFKK